MPKRDILADFVVDVHTEPLPARFVAPALAQLHSGALQGLSGRLVHGEIRVSGTHRHLVLTIQSVAARGADVVQRFKGPKEQAWRTAEGNFTPAAEGFARRYHLSPAELKVDNGVLYAEVLEKGRPAAVLLAEMILQLLRSLEFPKTMSWEESGFRFGRPIRAITALLGSKVVPVELAGVKSGRAIYGHPLLTRAPRALKDAAGHAAALRKGLVIVDPADRRERLRQALESAAKSAGGCPDLDEALMEESVFLAEHPVAVLGRLRPEHMALPAALLATTMKKQLKFFPILDPRGGLKPVFVGVRDGLASGTALVREGYQRVLEARFNDAAFFFGRDGASRLESKRSLLERVTYQKALGSMAQKAARVESLAAWIGERLRSNAPVDERTVVEAARLIYADLVSEVVKEFPELQGTMGGAYARKDGLDERTALAIEQFYFPVGAKAPIPATPEACVVSLAGKLDGLAGCFAAGLIPTGSADPFALRRQALGILRILLEKQLPLDLEEALVHAVSLQPVAAPQPDKLAAQLMDFIWGRAQSHFEEIGFAVDEVRSVRAGALRDLPSAFRRLAAVRAVRRDPAFESLAAAFKRAANILKQAGSGQEEAPNRALLKEEPELALYDALVSAEDRANQRAVNNDFEGALKSLVSVKPSLDSFFDKVLVMAEDEQLRRQRLALLNKLIRAFKRVADISEIQPAAIQ